MTKLKKIFVSYMFGSENIKMNWFEYYFMKQLVIGQIVPTIQLIALRVYILVHKGEKSPALTQAQTNLLLTVIQTYFLNLKE